MSTRAVIARRTGEGWEGRYHHWDGYPSGLGAELFQLGRQFGADEVRRVLIDEHPGGWSTILGADWTYPPGYEGDSNVTPCKVCGRAAWSHYQQYYFQPGGKRGQYNTFGLEAPPSLNGDARVGDHAFEAIERPTRPQCYCHGGRSETSQLVTSDGSDSGTEWAYVVEDDALVIYERSWNNDGSHAMGLFGLGASDTEIGGSWTLAARISWMSPEPNWDEVSAEIREPA